MTIDEQNNMNEESSELYDQVLSMIREDRDSISIIQIDRRPRHERNALDNLISPGFERVITGYSSYSIEARNRFGNYSDQTTIFGGNYEVFVTNDEKQLSEKLASALCTESLEIILKLGVSGTDIIFSKRNA